MSRRNSGAFVEWLREYLESHGQSPADLASAAGLSGSTLVRILRERNRRPSYNTLIKLSHATGENPNRLLELVELPAVGEEAPDLNPLRPKVLEVFDAMSPSMQRSYVSVGKSLLQETRKEADE